MAVKKPLVLTAGQIQELQSADEINIDASDVTTGTIATQRLASGTANSTTFLRGDQTWASAGDTTYTVTTADCENTSAKTTIASFVVPANTCSDGERITLWVAFEFLNNQASGYNLTTYVSGTGITETSGLITASQSSTIFRGESEFVFTRLGTQLLYMVSSNGNLYRPFNNKFNPALAQHTIDSLVDYTTDITLQVDVKHNLANANVYFRTLYAKALKLTAGQQ